MVRDLSLVIPAGRIFWVVGANGAGKTSLLRVLAGIDRPAGGSVAWRTARPVRPLYFHPEARLPAHATADDWERLVRRLLPPGSPPRTPLRPVVRLGAPVARLSTGERKRLLLDALLRLPGPMLLDEPYEHLSPDAKEVLTAALGARASRQVVVVATNQATPRPAAGGLRLEGGSAELLAPGDTP